MGQCFYYEQMAYATASFAHLQEPGKLFPPEPRKT